MTYATLLTDESESSKMLVRITPNIKLLGSDFTVYDVGLATTSYRMAWTRGPVRSAKFENQTMTESQPLATAGQLILDNFYYYYHDVDAGYLYIGLNNSVLSASSQITIGYDLFFATHPIVWHSDALDTAADLVEYKPLVVDVPSQNKSVADQMLGYSPIAASNIGLANEDQYFNEIISSHSFNLAPIKCWHLIGDELSAANMSLFIDSTCSDISTDYSKVNITINSDDAFFDKEFRPYRYLYLYNGSDFLNNTEFSQIVDPRFVGRPKRVGFGYNKKVRLVNAQYNETVNTESTNSYHVMGWSNNFNPAGTSDNCGLIPFQTLINYSTTTTTKIYFTNSTYVRNFELGDRIVLNNTPTTYFGSYGADIRNVINNPLTDGYVEINSAFAFSSSTSNCYRFTIPRLYVEINSVLYKPRNGIHYNVQQVGHCELVGFLAGYVASLGMPRAVNHTDAVYGDWYGIFGTAGTALSADNSFNAFLHPISFLYDFLLGYLLVPYSSLNISSFNTASDVQPTDRISFVLPQEHSSDWPNFLEVINTILISGKLRMFKDENGLWNFQRVDVPSDDSVSISENEAIEFTTEYDSSDILSDITVEYGFQERGDTLGNTEPVYYSTSTTAANSDKVKGFYGVSKQKTFRSYHFDSDRAALLLTFLESVFNHRRGTHSIKLGREYFNLSINDLISITMDRVAGSEYDGTQKTVQGVVTEINKTLDKVQITLDDQTSW